MLLLDQYYILEEFEKGFAEMNSNIRSKLIFFILIKQNKNNYLSNLKY